MNLILLICKWFAVGFIVVLFSSFFGMVLMSVYQMVTGLNAFHYTIYFMIAGLIIIIGFYKLMIHNKD